MLKGAFAGRQLEDLAPLDLAHLWQDCRFSDPQSAQILEAYLDRAHPTWREDLGRTEVQRHMERRDLHRDESVRRRLPGRDDRCDRQ